jgi:hypothetical protein
MTIPGREMQGGTATLGSGLKVSIRTPKEIQHPNNIRMTAPGRDMQGSMVKPFSGAQGSAIMP